MPSVELNFISQFPEDVSNLILLKVPIKSLLACSCVCKIWNSFIRSPAFVSSHLNRAIASSEEKDAYLCLLQICSLPIKTGRGSFFLRSKDQDLTVRQHISFPVEDKYGFQVVSSCNGLVCLMHGKIHPCRDLIHDHLFLWNPIIRKSIILNKRLNWTALEAVGLGFDSRSGDYKLVTVIEELGNASTLMVNLYSLKANSWKQLPDVEAKFDGKMGNIHRGMTYLNGALYFVARKYYVGRKTVTRPSFVIWEFDLSEEVFHEVMLPDCVKDIEDGYFFGSHHFYLLTCGESLAVLWFRDSIREMEIWVMKEHGVRESWAQLSTIRLGAEVGALRYSSSLQITGLVFTKDARVLLSVGSTMNDGGRIFSHDLKSQETKEIINVGKHNCFFLGDYVESLALLDKGDDLSRHFEIESDDDDDDVNDTSGSSSSSSSNEDSLIDDAFTTVYLADARNATEYDAPLGEGIAGLEEDSNESDSSKDLANSSSFHAMDDGSGLK